MEVCEFALCCELRASSRALRCGEKKSNNISARPRTNHRERPGHVSAIHFKKHFIFVFSTQVSYFSLNLSLSFNLSDFTLFSRNSLNISSQVRLPGTPYIGMSQRVRTHIYAPRYAIRPSQRVRTHSCIHTYVPGSLHTVYT